MSASGQINWDSVAPRANAGAASGGVNWDSVAPRANPAQPNPEAQHVQAHPLKGQNFGDWLSEELLAPVVNAATQLGRGIQGLGHPEQRPLTDSVKDVVQGGSQIVAPFAAAGLNSEQAPAAPPPADGVPSAVGTAIKGAATGAVKAIPKAAETSILRYTGIPQITRGAITGAKEALKARAEAMTPPPEAPAPAPAATAPAAPAVDPLLDKIAQGFGAKDFSSLGAEQQATVRELGARMTGGQAAATAPTTPPAYTPRPPEYYGVKPQETPPQSAPSAPATPQAATPAPAEPAPAAPPTAEPAPTAKVQPIRPETPQPKPASGAATANAIDKANRFVKAIQDYNAKFNAQPITADSIADLDDSAKGVLARALSGNGLLPKVDANKFPNTSWPYIVTKLRQAEYTAPSAVRSAAPSAATAEPPAPAAQPAEVPAAPSTPPTAAAPPKTAPMQYKGFLATLGNAERENLFSVMREYGNRAMKYAEQHAQLRPKYGEIAVGGAHMDPLINQYAIEAVSRELGRGATIEDAIAAGKQEAALTAQKFNERVQGSGGGGMGYQIHRPEGLANSMLDEYGRRLRAALQQ